MCKAQIVKKIYEKKNTLYKNTKINIYEFHISDDRGVATGPPQSMRKSHVRNSHKAHHGSNDHCSIAHSSSI